jgi:olefin beta-lactone synthetase
VNVAGLFTDRAAQSRDAPALTAPHGRGERTLTFDDLERDSARAASALRAAGLRPGDRVLALYPMGIDLYVSLIAVLRAGCVATFIDPGAGRRQLEHACAIAAPASMVGSPAAHVLAVIKPALRRVPRRFAVNRLPFVCSLLNGRRHGGTDDAAVTPRADADPALVTFTSGSTGQPKAAMRSHGFLRAQLDAVWRTIPMRSGETELATMPVFVLASLTAGVHVLIADADLRRPGRIDPGRLLKQIARHRPARCIASPALFERLADRCLQTGAMMNSLTQVYTGGAPVFPHVLRRLQRAAPHANVVAVYGSTEAEPIASLPLDELAPKDTDAMHAGYGLPVGAPEPFVQVRVIDNTWGRPIGSLTAQAFAELNVAAEQPGEIVVSGEHVLTGYLDGVGDDETKFKVDGVGWHRTGDIGRFDTRGRLWLLGRAEAIVRDARGELFPLAVEATATGLDGLGRCALCAFNGRRILFVESRAGVAAAKADEIRRRLAWAQLDDVIAVPRIPVDRRHNAKVDYPALAALAARHASASPP